MAVSASHDLAQAAFERTMRDFRRGLGDEALYSKILETKSIDDVYDLTDELQKEQRKQGHLRHLSKIKPYLERLQLYANTIDTFIQAKPDILALIWGPIKLLIQWTSTLSRSLDAIIDTTAEIGLLIPEFRTSAELFKANALIKDVLALFFQDMLDFYLVTLKFFSSNRWRHFFEALWPRQEEKIKVVINNLSHHTRLLRNEVRLEDLREARQAREQAMASLAKLEKSNRYQEYSSIETTFSPRFYHDKLNWLHGLTCQGTGQWLLRNDILQKWLDFKDHETKVLWLQGIPGAGKTFLAGTVVDTVMTSCRRTIYAFLSHTIQSSTSALSILHSLIFQLARCDQDLQDVVCERSREKLHSHVDVAVDILKSLLTCAGPVYVIIDGVDEVSEIERIILLQQLLNLSRDCKDIRILISSRAEDDIRKALEPVSATVRVDSHNAGSIQAFVSHCLEEWLQTRSFDPCMESEIRGLLAPLAFQAKGMFLYAKIILRSIELLNDPNEIRNELRVLPDTLDDAYGRILDRINKSLPLTTQEKSRKILGWVGISPVPLSLEELEQALAVREGDLEGTGRVGSRLNLVQLCGPVVEVADGYVQFVHFTAKEYLFSPKVSGSLDTISATLSLALCCTTYLCQSHHDPDIEREELVENAIHGDYRLHHYSVETWSRLVEQYVGIMTPTTSSLSSELLNILELLLITRNNTNFAYILRDSNPDYLGTLKGSHPGIHKLLCDEAYFRRKVSSMQYDIANDNWLEFDPLSVRNISHPLAAGFDALLCPRNNHSHECHCQSIYFHYGERLFKCGFISCEYHRVGFESRSQRASHMKYHDRPWKCDFPSCDYNEIGFLSRRMRNDHLDREHRSLVELDKSLDTNLGQDEVQPTLFALVKADNVGAVLSLQTFCKRLESGVLQELRRLASFSGSPQMLETLFFDEGLLTHKKTSKNSIDLLKTAIEGCNIEILQWLAQKLQLERRKPLFEQEMSWISISTDEISVLISALKSDSVYVYDVFLQDALVKDMLKSGFDIAASSLCCSRVISATQGIPQRENFLLSMLKQLNDQKPLDKNSLGQGLGFVADTTCSIPLARAILDQGANVNYRRGVNFKTPLHRAARKDTTEAAQLIKFLLENGADPEASCLPFRGQTKLSDGKRVKVSEEKGAKGISKWLGITWDELVDEVMKSRENEKNTK